MKRKKKKIAAYWQDSNLAVVFAAKHVVKTTREATSTYAAKGAQGAAGSRLNYRAMIK